MSSSQSDLTGKTALVAGDSRYWTRYAAVALAEAGARVAIAGLNSQRLASAVGETRWVGAKPVSIIADTTKLASVEAMLQHALDNLGRLDILVNASDVHFAKPFLEITRAEWDRLFDLNLNSVFNCCQAVGREMLKVKKGRIINITSCLAARGMANSAAYCASMGGVLQLTRALALEWAREGITVNAIGAGWMSEIEKTGLPREEELLKYIPLRRYGNPSEIGPLLTYLASDEAAFLTAEFIPVDGAVMDVL